MKRREMDELVNTTITSLGLTSVENHRIGNPIQRGISGGQKRRVTVGTSLVTCPKVSSPTESIDDYILKLWFIDTVFGRADIWFGQYFLSSSYGRSQADVNSHSTSRIPL
jgi:ABC-type uncharacterized transport system YnjBCD ATPase subunit